MKAQANPVDVLIIGAGPTGLTAAHELARRGVACRIIDKNAEPVQHSQALAVQVRTLETLDIMGISQGWVTEGFPLRTVVARAFGKRLPTVELGGVDSPFSTPLAVGQQVTERLLGEALAARGVTVERSLEAVDVVQDEAGVDVTLRNAAGETSVIRARWVIDAEGSHSMAREKLGVAFEGDRNPQQEMIQADAQVASAFPAGQIHFFVEGDRAVALFPFDGSGHCRVLCIVPPSDPPRYDPPTLEEVQAEVRRVADPSAVLSESRWLNRFRTQHRLAGAFRKGRVFFAGDAAHVHVPVGGQGMNYGIQDAFNLAWKLAGVVRGELSSWVLETYEGERRPAAAALVEATERVFHNLAPDGGAGALRQAIMPLVATGALGLESVQEALRNAMAEFTVNYRDSLLSESHGGGHVAAGERMPDAPAVLAREQRTVRLFELVRSGWLLLLFTGLHGDFDPPLSAIATAHLPPFLPASIVHATRETVTPAGTEHLLDLDHGVHEAFGVKHAAAYLVRPDGYVAFSAALDAKLPDRLHGFLQRTMHGTGHGRA